jgi:Transglutaminase-like superfamily
MTQAVDVRSLVNTLSDDLDQYDYDHYEFLQVAVDPPTAADLAETEDIQLTDAVKAKATELGNNPVKIYNWVRNNIEFIPSYGSIQGADRTLQTKRGNAMDTASLLIGLLRAANIPETLTFPHPYARPLMQSQRKPHSAEFRTFPSLLILWSGPTIFQCIALEAMPTLSFRRDISSRPARSGHRAMNVHSLPEISLDIAL